MKKLDDYKFSELVEIGVSRIKGKYTANKHAFYFAGQAGAPCASCVIGNALESVLPNVATTVGLRNPHHITLSDFVVCRNLRLLNTMWQHRVNELFCRQVTISKPVLIKMAKEVEEEYEKINVA